MQMIRKPKRVLEEYGLLYNDFLSLFLKPILKNVLAGMADTVNEFRRTADPDAISNKAEFDQMQTEKGLPLKLSEFQREQLFALLDTCMSCSHQVRSSNNLSSKKLAKDKGVIDRPILQNLHNMRYKCDPEKYKNMTKSEAKYKEFYREMVDQNKQAAEEDILEIPLDPFAANIRLVADASSLEVDKIHLEYREKAFPEEPGELDASRNSSNEDSQTDRESNKAKTEPPAGGPRSQPGQLDDWERLRQKEKYDLQTRLRNTLV